MSERGSRPAHRRIRAGLSERSPARKDRLEVEAVGGYSERGPIPGVTGERVV